MYKYNNIIPILYGDVIKYLDIVLNIINTSLYFYGCIFKTNCW